MSYVIAIPGTDLSSSVLGYKNTGASEITEEESSVSKKLK
jgi:hypothetical protein